jgi:hypothetical protein
MPLTSPSVLPAAIAAPALDQLEARLQAHWGAIHAARDKTVELRNRLKQALIDLTDPSSAVIVTGSLGRGEATAQSDADWFLLLDGPSNPQHGTIAREVSDRIQTAGFKGVGPSGTFGNLVISHELVHYIAGTRDTNENLTRRMLLLAESWEVTESSLRERVLRNVLARYIIHDYAIPHRDRKPHRIPHFLVNDVVRYWRTMASDYACKMWERDRQGWGLRNAKLRFSRKLILAWGLIASFAGELFPSASLDEGDPKEFHVLLAEHIRHCADVTPLELLAQVASDTSVSDYTRLKIFGSYDNFLRQLATPEIREHLDRLPFDAAPEDEIYGNIRKTSEDFRNGVQSLFFDEHEVLKRLIRQYGVF